jgi:hypothetical protein
MEKFDRKAAYSKWMQMPGKLSVAGLGEESLRQTMSVLLENQERLDARELNEDQSTTVNFGSNAGDGARFSPIALALVRRVFPDLFAHKVIGVQALNSPVGFAYALRYAYDVAGIPPGSTFNGGSDIYEAGFKMLNAYSGYTGSTAGSALTSGVQAGLYDFTSSATVGQFGTGAVTSAAELWKVGTTMPNMKLFLDKVAIQANSRKLGAAFSLESAQDLKSMQGIEIEKEMLNILNYEVAAELDREILGRMMQTALNTANGGAAASLFDASSSDGRWSQEKFATIANAIVAASQKIRIKTRQGQGNFVIASPGVVSALQSLNNGIFTRNETAVNGSQMGVKVGTLLGSQIDVYVDTFATNEYALVGFKGEKLGQSGIVYLPYIPLLVQKTMGAEDASPRIILSTRYAILDNLFGSGTFYRQLNFTGLNAYFPGLSY